ncbi:MerR family transcriptional regulator [Paenibacillus sp. MBLB4367]|uniref:MerR family transcriptional regulator n=1 Tax=Paenibacillus sp. MBLB4367 TaxID=3384767 RepID=UPI003908005F
MKNKFSIGEMSKLHNTPVKTLRYYDEIDLFRPIETDPNSGYRYYSTEQFEHLNTINYLKALGVPLKDIRLQLESRDMQAFIDLLKREKENTERKIKDLEGIRSRFDNRIAELERAKRIDDLEVVHVRHIEERKIVSLRTSIGSEPELELSLRRLENLTRRTSSIFIGGVGLTICKEDVLRYKVDRYNSIFILTEQEVHDETFVSALPKGDYACIYFRGNHTDALRYYRLLLRFMGDNRLSIAGDAIERTIIDPFISRNKEDHLTEIQIPVTS